MPACPVNGGGRRGCRPVLSMAGDAEDAGLSCQWRGTQRMPACPVAVSAGEARAVSY